MKSDEYMKLLWQHVSKDVTRYHLSGVFADEDGSLVATDGHRMLVVNSGNVGLADFAGLHKGHIFNKAGLRVEGKYPAWRALMPKDVGVIPEPDSSGALPEHYVQVKWEGVPSIIKGVKKARRNVPRFYIDSKGVTSYKHEGTLVCVDASYLSVYYDMLEGGAEMWVKNEKVPIVIKNDFATAVLMPVRM